MSDSVRPHRRQPSRLLCPWGSPGKNTGVGCHFLLQCMKVKSLSRVRLFATPWTAAHQALPSMGFSRQEYWSEVPLPTCTSLSQFVFFVFFFTFWPHPAACGALVPQPGINPAPTVLEGGILTTGPPGKSLASPNFAKILSITLVSKCMEILCKSNFSKLWKL